MRQTSSVLYLAIDQLLPSRGAATEGLQEFFDRLSQAGIPCVWLTSKTRLQIDEPRRKFGHRDPFIAEDGCGVFLPEDYFHLRPQAPRSGKSAKAGANQDLATVRLGRFTCLPVAEPQPAASEALEVLAAESEISIVALSSLPPRQLAANTGLPPREAEFARQRDFDELFFFAGASTEQIAAFRAAAANRGMQLRQHGALWSLAVGANTGKGIRELAKLYDRALHAHAKTIVVAAGDAPPEFFPAGDRGVLLTTSEEEESGQPAMAAGGKRVLRVPLDSADRWERLGDLVLAAR